MLSCLMFFSHGVVQPSHAIPIHIRIVASVSYLPFIFAFIPDLSQIPCKDYAIQHHLQRLRLHQPAITPTHTHHRSQGGVGGKP